MKEKDVKISSLLNQIQILQKEKEKEKENISILNNKIEKSDITSENPKNINSIENGGNHDTNAAAAISNQKKIEKYEEDLKNIRLDVDRLQVEKKEAEVAGKSFLDRFAKKSRNFVYLLIINKSTFVYIIILIRRRIFY